MTKELLNLLNGHTFVDGHGGQGAAEFMRVDFVEVQLSTNFAQTDFYTADQQPTVGLLEGYKQGFVIIGALGKVSLKVNLRPGIKIDFPLLVALAENDTFPVFKVYIGNI